MNPRWIDLGLIAALIVGPLACGLSESTDDDSPLGTSSQGAVPEKLLEVNPTILDRTRPVPNPERNAYFGDLHVHTTYSFDAFVFGTTVGPREAYRYALGETIEHPGGFGMTLREPLDFYAVTDHALFLGVAAAAGDTSTEFSKLAVSEPLNNLNSADSRGLLSVIPRVQAFATTVPSLVGGIIDGSLDPETTAAITRTAWSDIIEAADQYNSPGHFTTFVAYEYTTSANDRGNLHRNVIFRGSDRIPAEPFSRFHSQNPEDLWDWLDGLRDQGIEALAIPHNSNGSNGQMFKMVDWAGNPLDDAYSEQRMRNEPLVELTQVKGTSETHPSLSDNDEWAEFEIMPYRVGGLLPSQPDGSYVRQALRRGLAMEEAGQVSPFRFGFVAASDTHTGAISDDEKNFFSKIGVLDATAELRGSVPVPGWQAALLPLLAPEQIEEVEGRNYTRTPTTTFGASGIAGVWAEENTREAIYDAFRRKETFATSGPRIRVRFFSGYRLGEDLLTAPDAVNRAYADGVAMGSDLPGQGAASPKFFAWAVGDPLSAQLQRLQVVKGWVEGTETFEHIYDVACSDGGIPGADTNRCPDNGAGVDLSDCSYSEALGSAELKAIWSDPDFDPDQRAFYYVRAIENPTCRWSTWDSLRAGVAPRPDFPTTIQERAWSSPIWFVPGDRGAIPAAG
ncbi:MAG: DUF3604 domain-containing protein [Myxococcota bacterium]|nr:DUF3604 domain-containing protein [Myxococcota bacterium]